MKKLLGIVVLGLILVGNAHSVTKFSEIKKTFFLMNRGRRKRYLKGRRLQNYVRDKLLRAFPHLKKTEITMTEYLQMIINYYYQILIINHTMK